MSAQTCGPIDFVFLQDLSGSFTDDLPILKSQIANVIATVEGIDGDADFAVASFIDKPTGAFGSVTDYVYQTHMGVSTNNAAVVASVNGLATRSGADGPEAQLEGLLQTALRTAEMGYRTDSTRIVMLSTDATYHVAGDFSSQPANNLDTVLDGSPAGTGEDYPTIDGLRAALVAANIFPVFSVTADMRTTYEALVAQLGFGAVVTLSSNSVNFSDAVRTAIGAACGTITQVGTDGDDVLVGTVDDDGIYGGVGNDDIDGAEGDDVVDGGSDDDLCRGGSGNDDVRGGSGNDDIYGDDGDDEMSGGLGDDTISGGTGADRFVINTGDGIDTITDFEDGIDKLDLSHMDKATASHAILTAVSTPAGGTKVTFTDGSSITLLGLDSADFDVSDVLLDATNIAPIALNDAATTIGTHSVVIDVLANDSDVEGDPISLVSVGAASHGTATILTDGTVSYVASAGYVGADSFTYTITDGTALSTGRVNVTINVDLEGSPGDDYLIGTAGIDVMNGYDGNDYIDARAGDDTIDGGAGDDQLFGGIGRDIILGGDGADVIVGGPSYLPDDPDNDTIDAGAGDDVVDGGADDDNIKGGTGNDILRGGEGDDKINGGSGDDILEGGTEHDQLLGGSGNDILNGGAGHDQMDGGSGHDIYLIGLNEGDDVIEEEANPAGSIDTIRLAAGIALADITFTESGGALILSFAGGGSVELAGQLDKAAKQVEFIEFADGGIYDLVARSYTPPVAGFGETEGDDIITGTAGDDVIDALGGNDRISAGDGNDILIGGTGNDILFGQEGEDTYRFSGSFGDDLVGDGINSNNDVIELTDLFQSDIRLFTNSADQLIIAVNGSSDTIAISEHLNGVSIETIVFADASTLSLTGGLTLEGTRSADQMYGTEFDDTIRTLGGADTIFGQMGNDTIYANGGDDVIYGDTNILTGTAGGADIIKAGNGNDRVLAGGGNDTVDGGKGDDDLFGLSGNDILLGASGNDRLFGGDGADKLRGGADADVFVFEADGMRDQVMDFQTGLDMLDFSALGITEAELSYRQVSSGKHLLIDTGFGEVLVRDHMLSDLDIAHDFLF